MRVAAIICTALLLAACAQLQPPPDEAAREAERTIRSLMVAWERGDATLLEELFWPDAVYDDFPNQHTYQGLDEIVGYVDALHGWADDVLWSVGTVHVTENGAVAEWILSAVQARPIPGQVTVGTSAEVVTNGVTVIELEPDDAAATRRAVQID